jgi:NAD(P)-dependent dehydrogenase (short-subunit alcohol dehydrogenase family)
MIRALDLVSEVTMKIDIDQLTESELIDLNHRIVARLRMFAQLRAQDGLLRQFAHRLRAVVQAIGNGHEVIPVSFSKSVLKVDIADSASIKRMFETTGRVDAVISAAGLAKFGPMISLSDADFALGLNNKLMGQVNLVRRGLEYVNDNGSFTLTSGILSRRPMTGSTAISLVNSAVEGFARAAALEMPRSIRIKVVRPTWVVDTLKAFNMDPSLGIPAELVARAYVQALEGDMNGEVLDAI